ncbi:MAG: histidine triad nucleotide-binding protein [Desulfuromonadales bacterium]|nr:histidine triad nucleotide-binding protein [Desulfuromonadales bacterium]
MSSCLFCKIINGEIPAKIIYRDDDLIVIEDINPVAPVHFLLIPCKHIENSLDIAEEDAALMGRILRVAAKIAKEKNIAEDGFRIVTNTNEAAGQSVFHIHFHLLGGRDLQWPPG